MNQTQSSTISRSKTYEITITALMTAVTCILAPMSIPIGPVPISFTNLAIYLSLYLLGWKKRNHQLSDLSFDRSCRAPGILRFHWWSGEIGRAYRWIYHRIYRNGSHCRTVHRQLPQTMDPAYWYDRRNHRMLPFRNRMVLYSCRLHLPGSSRSLCNPIHPCRPGKNDYCNDHRTDDKEKNTVIAADGKVSHKYRL